MKSPSKLLYSRPIDMYKACYKSEAYILTDRIYAQYIEPLNKYKKNIAKRHLHKILIDLYQAWYFDPMLCLTVSFNNNDHTLDGRYNKPKITKTTINIIKDLIKKNLLNHKTGMPPRKHYVRGPSYTSRIWPKDELINYFSELNFNIIDILDNDIDRETIILNKTLKVPNSLTGTKYTIKTRNAPIGYSDTPKIRAMRLILACYNLLLRKTHIDIGTAENYSVLSADQWGGIKRCFIMPNCFVYRAFVNSKFNNGGRVYGGWWQKCHPNFRKDIRINANPVVEVAFAAANIAILYQIEGVNIYDTMNAQDIYDVEIPEIDGVNEKSMINYTQTELDMFKRFLIKTIINNAINTKTTPDLFKSTIKAITAEQHTTNSRIRTPPPNILKTLSHKFLASVFKSIKQKHQPIAHYFLSGISPKLQFIESNMTMNLIEHFTALKVPILTIHDSYIIEKKWGEILVNAMKCTWIEEMSNLKANQMASPKRSKYLERLTSHENHYYTKHLFAEPKEIKRSSVFNYEKNKLQQQGLALNSYLTNQQQNMLTINELFEKRTSEWAHNIIEIRPINRSESLTKRYKTSLQQHQKWLSEDYTESDSQETRDRYKSFYAGINSVLYTQWLHSKPLWMQL